MDIVQLFASLGLARWVPVVTSVIGLFSVVAAIIPSPTPSSPSWYSGLRSVVDWLSANVGNGKVASHSDLPPSLTSAPAKSDTDQHLMTLKAQGHPLT